MIRRNADSLYYVSVLAEEQNLTRAAERLYISQPALTAYLNRLEAELGVRLFDRTVIPIRLTEAGRYYIAEMRRLEDMRSKLLDDMRNLERDSRRSLRVGIGRNRGALWLPDTLELVRREMPDVRIRLIEDRDLNMSDHVARGTLDVAIVETFAYIANLPHTRVGDESQCFVTGDDHPDFAGFDRTGNSPEQPLNVDIALLNRQTLLCPGVQASLNDFMKTLFASYRLKPRDIVLVANNLTAYRLAVKNFGCAFLSPQFAEMTRTAEKPLFIMPDGHPVNRRLYAAYPLETPSKAAALFIRCMKEVVAKGKRAAAAQR